MEREDLLVALRANKAAGEHPTSWFKGYTKLSGEDLEALATKVGIDLGDEATVMNRDKDEVAEEPRDEDVARALHEVPDGIPTTPSGHPVRVQVIDTSKVNYRGSGSMREFRRGTIFRGEHAWTLWDRHNDLVKAII